MAVNLPRYLRLLLILQFPFLLITATYLSLMPVQGSIAENLWDKPLHLIGWGGLYGSLQLAYLFRAKVIVASGALLFYSFLIEVAQTYVGREFSWLDLVANACGIALAYLAILVMLNLWQRWTTETG